MRYLAELARCDFLHFPEMKRQMNMIGRCFATIEESLFFWTILLDMFICKPPKYELR